MRRWKRFAPYVGVVVFTGLLGASVARLTRPEAPDYWLLAGGGAGAGLSIVGLLILLRAAAPEPKSAKSSEAQRGMNIMAVGLILAFLGWLLAVFISFPLGFGLALAGILVGISGCVVHFAYAASSNDG